MFAVGDDDQSIYAFRGANVANMQQFERDFATPEQPVKLIKLEQNYRSHGHILDAANALIATTRRASARTCGRAKARASRCARSRRRPTTTRRAFIVDVVQGLADDGVPLDEIALLYRSNAQSRVLEHALFGAGIPYRVYGGMRFFERAEVKHALAYLRLIAAPDDDGAFLRVVNFPPRGIGARTLEQLQDAARGAGHVAVAGRGIGRDDAARRASSLGAFVRLIETLRSETRALPLPEAVEHVIEKSGLLAHYKAEKDGQDRVENLEELVTAADAFVREAELADRCADAHRPRRRRRAVAGSGRGGRRDRSADRVPHARRAGSGRHAGGARAARRCS